MELANQLTSGKANDREKAKGYIYDYVAQNVTYDVQKYKNDEFRWDDSALKTLELQSGVCQDYAFLAIALLRASDIEARFVRKSRWWSFSREACMGRSESRWKLADNGPDLGLRIFTR